MASKDKKNLIRGSGLQIQRASLQALVKRRIYNDNEYPGEVYQILDNQIHVKLMPPIVRSIQQDHKEMEIDGVLPVKGSGLKEGDCVLVQRQDDHWIVTTILSQELYSKKLNKAITDRLLSEGMKATPALVRRAALS